MYRILWRILNYCLFLATELTEVKKGSDIQADLNTKYLCHSNKSITAGKVSVLLSNVTIEAYITNDTLSKKGKYFWRVTT